MNDDRNTTGSRAGVAAASLASLGAGVLSLGVALPVQAQTLSEGGSALRDGRIGYVITHRYWALYETPGGRTECPQGLNEGPREQFKRLFPEDGRRRSVVEAQLAREGEQWHPQTGVANLPFHEARGSTSYGLNLDGRVDADDFSSPEGEPGIDNQMYRAMGCIATYRDDGSLYHFENNFMQTYPDSRLLIELSEVDDLTNDDEVVVTTYRGMDGLFGDATGEKYLPGGTQRVDGLWSDKYIHRLRGRIVDGVLTTEPIDRIVVPWAMTANVTSYQVFRGMQLRLELTPEGAKGLLAGYVDVEGFHLATNTNLSTHHQSYGQLSSPSLYAAMKRLADGYPDESGQNTAISAAVEMNFVQVFVQHPPAGQRVAGQP